MRADVVLVRLGLPVTGLPARAAALFFNGAAGRGLIAASADKGNGDSTIAGTGVANHGSGVVAG